MRDSSHGTLPCTPQEQKLSEPVNLGVEQGLMSYIQGGSRREGVDAALRAAVQVGARLPSSSGAVGSEQSAC